MTIILLVLLLQPQFYREGDWVTYTALRRITSVSYDLSYVYMAGERSIARYDRRFDEWAHPLSISDGLLDEEMIVCGYDRFEDCLWVVSPGTIQKYNPILRRSQLFRDLGVSLNQIHSIGVSETAVWFASDRQLLKLERETGSWVRVPLAPADVVWWGRRSLLPIDSSAYPFLTPYFFVDENLVRYEISSLADDGRYLWVGTDGHGAWRYDPVTFDEKHFAYGLSSDTVRCLARDGDSLWIGGMSGESGPITLWDRENDVFRYFDAVHISGLNSNNVYAIEVTQEFVAFGTDQGVSLYEKKTDEWTTYTIFDGLRSDEVISFARDSVYLFSGTRRGLSVLDMETGKLESLTQLGRISVNDIVATGDTVLFATGSGVFLFDKGVKSWGEMVDPSNSLRFGATRVIEDDNGFWFGTYDGIVHYDRSAEEWTRWTVADHYYLGEITALAADEVNLWAGTEWGTLKFSKSKERWLNYTVEDGLASPTVTSILLEGNHVWFGTPRGLTRFYWRSPSAFD